MDAFKTFVRPEGPLGEIGAALMEQNGRPMAREAVRRLGLKRNAAVLEIGFGPGIALGYLADAVPDGQIFGVDPSAVMLRRAGIRNQHAINQGRLWLVAALADQLPLPSQTLDGVLAIDNLHFWPDRRAGLEAVARVLKTGAPFLCAFTPVSGGRLSGLASLMADVGFEDVVQSRSPSGVTIRGVRSA